MNLASEVARNEHADTANKLSLAAAFCTACRTAHGLALCLAPSQPRPTRCPALPPRSPRRTSSSSATPATRKTPTASAPITTSTPTSQLSRFTLVHGPHDADLILEMHYEIDSRPVRRHNDTHPRQFRVVLIDPAPTSSSGRSPNAPTTPSASTTATRTSTKPSTTSSPTSPPSPPRSRQQQVPHHPRLPHPLARHRRNP